MKPKKIGDGPLLGIIVKVSGRDTSVVVGLYFATFAWGNLARSEPPTPKPKPLQHQVAELELAINDAQPGKGLHHFHRGAVDHLRKVKTYLEKARCN